MDRPTDPSLMSRRTWLQASALIGLYAGVARATGATALAHGEPAADAIVIDAGLPGTASLTRSAVLPDIPTTLEAGYPDSD